MFSDLLLSIKMLSDAPSAVMHLKKGELLLKKGNATNSFLTECASLLGTVGVTDGKIYCVTEGSTFRLHFSKSIPINMQQRVRNLWGIYN